MGSGVYLTLRDRPTRDRASGAEPSTGAKRPIRTRERVATTVILLGIVSMLTDISTESVNAVLPKYLIYIVGLSPQAFGFVNGLYYGISALIRLLGGWISDRTDRPKWVAALGYLASALSRIGLLFSTTLAGISTIITADRLGKGLRTAPRDALIAASSPPESLGRAYGVHRSLDSLGAAIGPLLAFVILSEIADGFHAVFVTSLAFAVVGVAVLVLAVPNLRPRRLRRRPTDTAAAGTAPAATDPDTDSSALADAPTEVAAESARVSLRLLANPQMARLLGAAALLGLVTIGDAFLYLQLQLRDNLANNYYALLMVGMNASYLVAAIPLGRLADRVGRARVFIGGHVALLACYLCAGGPLSGAVLSIGCLVLLGVYYAATDGTLAAMAAKIVDPQLRASGIATAQTVMALAGFASSLLVGLLWAHIGLRSAVLWYCPVLAVAIPAAAVILLRVDRPTRPAPALVTT